MSQDVGEEKQRNHEYSYAQNKSEIQCPSSKALVEKKPPMMRTKMKSNQKQGFLNISIDLHPFHRERSW